MEAGIERGLKVDDFAPRLSFFFSAHNDFFEEIAKFRAARRIWAREMKRRFNAGERSQWLRFHVQTVGSSLTAQQPENNIVRVALQALAAVLGGAQSLHTNALDEALSIPTEKSARIALRTQQIIANESGVANTVDPLGGSYYVESLTSEIEKRVYEYLKSIDSLGRATGHQDVSHSDSSLKEGFMAALEKGFFQEEISRCSFQMQQDIEQKSRIVVGMNEYMTEESLDIPLFKLDEETKRIHWERLERVRRERDGEKVAASLRALRQAAEKDENLMPYFIDASRDYATLGEMCGVLRQLWGEYRGVGIKSGACY